ncbi:MAG: hypothetical protein C4K60_06480 [Ideonella sp. MAG2]|nr:MAG: hypothetical protein C4K60_06480 [Ideonella sp. MAG2]
MSEFVSGVDPASFPEPFAGLYRSHLQHLQLKGLRPKTVEAYARAMRRIGEHFDYEVYIHLASSKLVLDRSP